MKKMMILAAGFAGIVFAGCTNEELTETAVTPVVEKAGTPIEFGGLKAAVTRADATGESAATLLGNNFVVEGFKGDGTTRTVVFDHYNVNYVDGSANSTLSNTNGWEYVGQAKHANSSVAAQTIKYWDYAQNQYDFVAYSLGTADASQLTVSAIDPATIETKAYTIKGAAADLAGAYIADMVTAYNPADYQQTVTLKFRSLSAKVRIALYETVPGYSVKDVVFYTDTKTTATDGNARLFTTGDNVFNSKGTYTVYYPTTGSANKTKTDYNRAHLSFEADTEGGTEAVKSFGALDNFTGKETAETPDNYLGRNVNEATYAGAVAENYYTTVIPNEDGAELKLKVNYTLVSTDGGGEEINVYGASAKVPAVYAQWTSGYAYTYIFKISNNTNGSTNGIDPETGEPLGPAGLYPITFDAVVTETEDGAQETITTVTEPSITTYTKGKVVTSNENGEYEVGNNIYVVVDNGTTINAGGNVFLYTVTLEAGAAQELTEQAIDNALKNGTFDATAGTHTVTDANGKELVVTESTRLDSGTYIPAADSPTGNQIDVSTAWFTPNVAATYVFRYNVGANNYYKIIIVK
ncbi:MAG: hypothetical protein IJ527_05165 [Prevotella sp.]|nr:hypothetical protein [Prevotella sp.]